MMTGINDLREAIEMWLADPDASWTSGLRLYELAGSVEPYGDLLKIRYGFIRSDHRDRLREALEVTRALLKTDDGASHQVQPDPSPAPVGEMSWKERELRERGRKLKKRESFLHAKLVLGAEQPDTPERAHRLFRTAKELMEVEKELDVVYGRIREIEETGSTSHSELTLEQEEVLNDFKLLRNLRSSLSRYKNLLHRAEQPEKTEYYKRCIDERWDKISELEKKLGL